MKGCRAWVLVVLLLVATEGFQVDAQLTENFYKGTCPNVESIVKQVVTTKFGQTFVTIPATLRLFFHDCFSQGCDASILIASPNGDAEKDAPDNQSLAGDGFDTVIKAKAAVEASCPGVVSCADILAIAARDVVVLAGGPSFNVELGRRDGTVSKASSVPGRLPQPTFHVPQLTALFAKNNLNQVDMIALSGAHTVGFSHCTRQLKQECPQNVDPRIAVNMDQVTPQTFDNQYYKNLVNGMGMFTSDQDLFTNNATRAKVIDFANNAGDFNAAFATAMRKLGRVNVQTGTQGQIRKDCTAFNS
ncbi:hypothetical protein MLD38_000107 [Melastoma candidum]|uniref:Uncharacterized protein n=1 Tax=Melastoma candidum TaxID=119954 RepID=A0ACB9SCZ2_9MYRT|nr:hypothetical protein MLD38_000107 [Melastoma candidum]